MQKAGDFPMETTGTVWAVLPQSVEASVESAEADLAEDALTGEQFGTQTDDEAQHGQAAIPGLSECNKTEAGRGSGISHGFFSSMPQL